MRLRCMLIGLLTVLLAAEVCAEVYRYKDEDGVIHFTDNYIEIPDSQRPKVETVLKSDESDSPAVETETGGPEEAPPADDPAEAGQPGEQAEASQLEAAVEGNPSQQQFEGLIKAKSDLDKIYASLASEKEVLEKEEETLKTLESMRAYQNKVNLFNKKLADYERQRQAFQVRADAYNRSVDR